jgi:diguanylate cyclase (GGDEF)-like protein/PAS domain S-box-containing protein
MVVYEEGASMKKARGSEKNTSSKKVVEGFGEGKGIGALSPEMETEYFQLYEFAPVGYLTLDRKGAIQKANLAGAEMVGRERGKLLKRRLGSLVSLQSRPTFTAFLEKVFTGGKKEACEVELLKTRQGPSWVTIEAVCDEARETCRAVMIDITSHKETAENLSRSDSLLQLVANHLPAFVAYVSASDLCYRFVNLQYEKSFQLPRDQIIGQPVSKILSKSNFEFAWPYIQRALQGEACSYENTFFLEGEQHWIQVNFVPHRDETGNVTGIVILNHDLTEHKRTEEILRESEEKFRTFIEHSNNGIILVDRDGLIIEWNQAQEQISGIPRMDAIGRPAWEVQTQLVPHNFRDRITQERIKWTMRNALESGASSRFNQVIETPIETVSGESKTLLQNAFPIKTDQGYRLGVVLHDITERKNAEKALEESEWRHRIVSELLADSIYVADVDPSGIIKVRWVSGGMFRITEQSLDDIGTSDFWGDLIYPDDRLSFLGFMSDILSTAKAGEVECRVFHKNGEIRWVHVLAQPQIDSENHVTAIIGAIKDITERKQAEDKLRESELRFRTIIEGAPVAIAVSRKGFGLFANKKFAEMMGLSDPEEFFGRPVAGYFAPQFQEESRERTRRRALGLPVPADFETIGLRSDGLQIPLQVTIAQVHLADGDANMAFATDITEHKQAESALKASEERWRSLVKAIPDYVSLHDREGRFLFLNHYADGFLEKDVIGSSVFQYLSPKSVEVFKRGIEACHLTGMLQIFEHTAMGNHGEMREYEDYIIPIIENNEPMKTLLVSRDITERKQAGEALQNSERRFRAIFEQAAVGVAEIDSYTNRFLSVNDKYCDIVGYEPDELLQMTYAEITHPDDLQDNMDNLRSLLSGQSQNFSMEKRYIRKNGNVIWGKLTVSPLWIGDALESRTHLVIMEDITERKQTEEALLEANRLLMSLHETLRDQATRDALTGLFNRRYLYETMERELARAQRGDYPVSIIMIDIDHFKGFNDTYGHQAGDEILMALGNLLHHNVRQGDIACRYGGEEFIVIMPGADNGDTEHRANAIRQSFSDLKLEYNRVELSTTVSIGVAYYPIHGDDITKVIKAADDALYEAKQAGRNCVRVWGHK